MQSTTGRILVIVSYNGYRHQTRIVPSDMLRIQYKQLSQLQHSLDKILIVKSTNGDLERFPDPDYQEALGLFSDVLIVENNGSYGGWKEGFLAYPDFEWYFFIEDDYTFRLDHFDQKWIDLWRPEMTYLCQQVGDGGYGKHAACSAGLTRGDILKTIDWTGYRTDIGQYNSQLQVQWSKLFGNDGLYDYTSHYNSIFWTGGNLVETDPKKPALLVPMQAL